MPIQRDMVTAKTHTWPGIIMTASKTKKKTQVQSETKTISNAIVQTQQSSLPQCQVQIQTQLIQKVRLPARNMCTVRIDARSSFMPKLKIHEYIKQLHEESKCWVKPPYLNMLPSLSEMKEKSIIR